MPQMTKNVDNRPATGSALTLMAGTGAFFVMVAVALIVAMISIGGHHEGTNANDAGTLNVARSAPLVDVVGAPASNSIYASVAEGSAHNKYSLKSINRVWGHAFLTMLNNRSMNMSGTGTAASRASEDAAWTGANAISDKLAAELNEESRLKPYSLAIINSLNVRMIGQHPIAPGASWLTACMERGTESNMRLTLPQLPPHITAADLGGTGPGGGLTVEDGELYLRGYHPISFGEGRYVNFVPFQYKKQPHHVSLRAFEADRLVNKPYPQWRNPVPNSFRCEANVTGRLPYEHRFSSAAIANPMQLRDVAIPNGFVTVHLSQDKVKWLPDLVPLGQQVNVPKRKSIAHSAFVWTPVDPLSWFEPFLRYGHQYYDVDGRRTLYQAIFAAGSAGDTTYARLVQLLTNRINEIKPGTSWNEIVALLRRQEIGEAGDEYVIALNPAGALTVCDAHNAAQVAGLNQFTRAALAQGAHPDGGTFSARRNVSFSLNNLYLVLHWKIGPFGIPIPKVVGGGSIWRHTVDVTPGTGVNGALLNLDQHDTTWAFFGDFSDRAPFADEGAPVTTAPGCTCM